MFRKGKNAAERRRARGCLPYLATSWPAMEELEESLGSERTHTHTHTHTHVQIFIKYAHTHTLFIMESNESHQ